MIADLAIGTENLFLFEKMKMAERSILIYNQIIMSI